MICTSSQTTWVRRFFFWWIGVVEDRLDPKKLGRLRVRVLGTHTEDKQLIPTCELHWAYVYQPITWNQAMNGLGHSPTGPAEGTWVWGFFKDNESAQDPIVLGTIAGIPEEPPQPSIGFYDPSKPHHMFDSAPRKIRRRHYPNNGSGAQNKDETTASLYPRQTHPWGCIIGESDINRLARAENVGDTVIGVRNRQRDNGRPNEFGGVPIAMVHPTPGRKWVEQESAYAAQYPYNHVFETESGHVVEFDDTPGHERIHIMHRSLTYIEIDMEGNMQMKIVGKRRETTMENSYSHFQNAMNVTVDGEVNIYCRSDANLQVDGNLKAHIQGNYEEKVHGNKTIDIDGNLTVKVGGNIRESAGGSYQLAAGGVITQSAGGKFSLTSGAEIAGDAPVIHWNSGRASSVSVQAPSVPPFPAPLGMAETINESAPDPVCECKPDPSPDVNNDPRCGDPGTKPNPVPCDC